MKYSEVIFTCKGGEDWQKDLLIQDLAALGFDTFEDRDSGFAGYIASEQFDRNAVELLLIQQPEGFVVDYEYHEIVSQNWNEVWESNFNPIVIDEVCYIRATFHQPRLDFDYEIIIDPKMAFGTGHHQTTSMMVRFILKQDLQGAKVLDMGCGTGILAILAGKRGAQNIVAIDNDPVCISSTDENILLNNISNISTVVGSVDQLDGRIFDVILANINRNILIDHLPTYAKSIKKGGDLYLSGFFEDHDLEIINKKAQEVGFVYQQHQVDGNWAASHYIML